MVWGMLSDCLSSLSTPNSVGNRLLSHSRRNRDSGSHEHGSSFQIVAMEKEFQTGIMHKQRFGERERFANKATQPLSQRVIPSLHMRRFSRFFSDCCML